MYSIRCLEYLKQKLDGFSLVEASITLTIIGLVSIVGLGAIKRWRQQQQITVTQNHQEQILTAMALYSARTGNFPYPGDSRAPPDIFGLSRTIEGVPKDQVGIVPYRTLGLPESAAKDGYGRYFTYVGGSAGHAICTSEPRFPLSVHQRLPNGSLPQIVPAAGDGDPIVIILISHGINGYGAWEGEIGKTHQKLSGTYGPDEHENVKATQAFIVAPVSYERRSYYDDHVIWITRNHLLAMYAKMICNPSERPFV